MTGTKMNSKSTSELFEKLNNFGRFQIIQFILICVPSSIGGMMMLNYIFVTEQVEFRCRIPECDSTNASVNIPEWWDGHMDLKCHRPIIVPSEELSSAKDPCEKLTISNKMVKCQEWIYSDENSFMAQLNLGCQESKMTLIGTFHNAAMTVSNLFAGWLCDRFGRRRIFLICSIGGVIGLTKIFAANLYLYIGIEFMESLITSGVQTAGLVLLMEIGGESKRVLVGVLFSYAFYMGEITYAAFAMILQNWKSLIIAVYSSNLIFLIYVFITHESTRWQIVNGKINEAKKTFKAIAKFNKLGISNEEVDAMNQKDLLSLYKIYDDSERETLRDAIKSKEIMIRLAVTSFCFFSTGFTYYGLAIYSVYLPGNKYTNFMLTSLTSFPGDFLAFVTFSKFGRRISLQCGFIVGAICILTQAYISETIVWLKIVLFLFGKLGISLCFTGMFTYSLELFPTSIRGTLVALGNSFARIGSMLSPLTPLLGQHMAELPAILFSITAATAAILLILAPETKALPLFDTIIQVNAHKKECIESKKRVISNT